MRVLLISIVLYLTGVVAVLYYRPSLMFMSDGRWKQFSTRNTEDTTILPFWTFCVGWALISYLLSRMFVTEPVGAVAATAAANSSFNFSGLTSRVAALAKSVNNEPGPSAQNLVQPLPVPEAESSAPPQQQKGGKKKPKPGYYKLKGGGAANVPKYIYVGEAVDETDSEEDA